MEILALVPLGHTECMTNIVGHVQKEQYIMNPQKYV